MDVVGISDPIEKIDEASQYEKTLQFLKDTTELISKGRYEVRLPFEENHAPVSTNFEISRNRLYKVIEKLKAQKMLDVYGNIFDEWLLEGVIEEITGVEI